MKILAALAAGIIVATLGVAAVVHAASSGNRIVAAAPVGEYFVFVDR